MRKAIKIPIALDIKATMPARKCRVSNGHIFVDSQGLPHAIVVTTTNVTDRQGALAAIKQHPEQFESHFHAGRGGYKGKPFADEIQPVWGQRCRLLNAMSFIPSA